MARIVVIDGEERIRTALPQTMEMDGHEVILAENGGGRRSSTGLSTLKWFLSKKIKTALLYMTVVLLVPAAFAEGGSPEAKAKTGTINLVVTGFKSDKGLAMIALVNSKKSFKGVLGNIKSGKATHLFKNIPFGEYTIKVFHDINGHKDLDTNLLGIPKEKYGFSNNARGTFGPPD